VSDILSRVDFGVGKLYNDGFGKLDGIAGLMACGMCGCGRRVGFC
jgi:hypothetical protein